MKDSTDLIVFGIKVSTWVAAIISSLFALELYKGEYSSPWDKIKGNTIRFAAGCASAIYGTPALLWSLTFYFEKIEEIPHEIESLATFLIGIVGLNFAGYLYKLTKENGWKFLTSNRQ